MAPRLTFLMFSGSRKKKPRYTCLGKAKASHQQRTWAEVSSSAPHFLHNGPSISPIKCRCLLRVLCPVRRPVTTLDCILLKDKILALVPRQGPEINSQACLWALPRLRHCSQCWFTNQRLIWFLRSCLETPKAGSGHKNLEAETHLASPPAISLPLTPACPGTQYSPTACRAETSFGIDKPNKNVVLTSLRAFKAAWLTEQIFSENLIILPAACKILIYSDEQNNQWRGQVLFTNFMT
jgi:hypothetical protein